MKRYDIAIVGAGMAGASLAADVAPHASVLLLEAEDMPGYHATGRSAAFWSETYGGPGIAPLTTASRPALQDGGFLSPMGSLHLGRTEDAAAIERFVAAYTGSGIDLRRVDPREHVLGLRGAWTLGLLEPSSAFIHVAALHADCLGRARRAGAELVVRAPLAAAIRVAGGWELETGGGSFSAGLLVDAAGAWADRVATLAGVVPIGIQAYRRTMVQLRTDPPASPGLPHVADINGSFYFKPEAGGRLWLSPHDETAVDPSDVQPEEIDVAHAIDRLEGAVDWRVAAVERKWAGLRSFASDRLPVYGFDPAEPGFFWCAGQGGFGIQTAPAAAALAAAVLLGQTPAPTVAAIDPARYGPDRLR